MIAEYQARKGFQAYDWNGALMRLINLFNIILTSVFLLFIPAKARSGEFCGSKEGYINQLTASFLIPDYFPPETEALRELVSDADYQKCQRLAVVPLGSACQKHDDCYNQQLGKDQCDRSLQDNWVKACRSTYYKLAIDHYTCRLACESFVKIMSQAQRYDSQGICPSCEAYQNATTSMQGAFNAN
jgi:hypothetical protein